MSRPLFRVRVAGPDARFQPLAVAPGQLMLDRWNSVDKFLGAWLGRFIAKPEWHDDAFRYFIRNEQGEQLAGIACTPATAADLRGPLRQELAALRDKLRKAQPATATEKLVYDYICRGLLDPQPDADFAALNCQFFKYRDVQGQLRLAWCYGYEPTIKRGDATPLICPQPDCHMLQMWHAGLEPKCLECGQPFPVPLRRKRSVKVVLALLLLLLMAGAAGGYLALRPSSTLTGSVVRQGDGRPVADAVLHVEGYTQQVQTDAEGKFTLPNLHWGKRRVIARAPGYQHAHANVELPFHDANSVDLTLTGAAQLAGRVVYRIDDQQTPIRGAQVAITGRDATPVATDEEGRFQLTGIMPGETALTIKATGFRDQEARGEATADAGEPLELVMTGARSVNGQVVYAADSKTPIAQAAISPIGFDGKPVRTAADGKFQLDGLPPGEVKLKVTAAGFTDQSVPVKPTAAAVVALLAGDATLTGEVRRFDTQAPVANAEVQLPGTPYAARTDEQGTFRLEGVRSGPARVSAQTPGLAGLVTQDLAPRQTTAVKIVLAGSLTATGRVIDEKAKAPVVGATVAVADTNISTRTDSAGRYSLPGLAEGAIQLSVATKGFLTERREIEPTPEKAELEDIVLRPGASVAARVLSAKDGRPLAKAEVAYGGEEGLKSTTDEQGRFTLGPVPPGTGKLLVSAPDHFPLRLEREFAVGDQSLEDLTLAVLASVRGRVLRGLDQAPLKDAVVAIAEGGGKVTTKADGSYEFPQAPAGKVRMASTAPGYEVKRWEADLAAGDQQLADILLEGNTLVKGTTRDGLTKKAIPGVKLEVTAGTYRKQITSDAQGAFVIGKLPPGVVEVKATSQGFMDASVAKPVRPDDATVEVPFFPLLELSGVVNSAASKTPVDKAVIEVTSSAGEHQGVSGKDGAFKLPGVAAGPIEVRVKAAGFANATVSDTISPRTSRLTIPLQPLLVVQGTVVDAGKNTPIPKAQVQLTAGGVSETITADANGRFAIRLPAGKVDGTAEAAGYCETPIAATVSAASPRLTIRMPAGRTLSGKVVNAVNNQPVDGARLEIAGPGGQMLNAVSDSLGAFEIKSAQAAATTGTVNARGFEPLQLSVPAGNGPLRVVLSPILLSGEVRLVLTWGDRPRDMDSHLYGAAAGGKPLHISFKNRMAPGATLDIDGKEGFGPETITIKNPGKYQYFVAHPENLGTKDGDGLAKSAAEVRVYYKGGKGEVLRVPARASGPLWHVLDVAIDPTGKVSIDAKKDLFYGDLRAD